ncbi:MAG: hypothetical protein ACRD7E_11190 [Bryobacteraceae bacterium]
MNLIALIRICVFFLSCVLSTAFASTTHLPLNSGNKWQLRSQFDSNPMMFEVVGQAYGAHKVRWHNPWVPNLEYHFQPAGNKILLAAMDLGAGVWDMPANTVFFDFDSPAGTSWSNAMGTFTVKARGVGITTSAGQFHNCIHISQRSPEGVTFDWILAPDTGIVQFGIGAGAYVLSAVPALVSEVAVPEALAAGPLPKGTRVLGLDVNMAGNNDYQAAINLAKAAGAQTVSLTVNWDQLETAPGQYDLSTLALANQYYPTQGLMLDLFVITMDPAGKHVPADLQGRRMNDPVVIERCKRLLDAVFTQLPDIQLNFLALGSEADLGLKEDPAAWNDYESFLASVRNHVRSKRPDLRVGVSATFAGLMGSAQPQLKRMNPDAIFVSYYPTKSTFDVKDPGAASADFAALASAFAGQPVIIEQIGYPSGSALGSSQTKQRAFISEVFKAWDRHSSQIHSVTFAWLTDLPLSAVDSYSGYYGLHDGKFREFLRTLGLRTYSGAGVSKPAYNTLVNEAKTRGW